MRIPNKSLSQFGFRQPSRLLNNSVARGLAPGVRAEDCGRSGCRGGLDQRLLAVQQVRGFNGIIPYEIPGMPSGVLEMGIGALLGYMVGNTQGRGAMGALFGLAAGAVLGQVQPTGTAAAGSGQKVDVPKAPGATVPGATPDKAPGSFDWDSAIGIVNNLLLSKDSVATGKSVYSSIKEIWGSKTAKPGDKPGTTKVTEKALLAPQPLNTQAEIQNPPPAEVVEIRESVDNPDYGWAPMPDSWSTMGGGATNIVWEDDASGGAGSKLED